MLVRVSNFSGIAPRLSAKLLQDNQAQEARNVRLASGEIRPLRAPLQIAADLVTGAKSIYLLKDKWLSWSSRVSAVPSPIADDAEYRLYFTGDGVPKKTWYAHACQALQGPYPGINWQPLAVKRLDTAPTLAITTGSIPTGSYAYVTTLITRFGPAGEGVLEESRPSPAILVTLTDASDVTVTRGTIPAGHGAEFWRVYRSTATGDYQLVSGDIPVATEEFADTLSAPLADVLQTIDWHEPPDDMQGLVAMPNGVMAAFSGNEILFSEPWYPHAWPVKYRQSIPGKVRAIAVAGSALVVLTDDTPWIISGSHPDSMTQERINIVSPCMSAASVVSDGYNVLYTSRDGIAAISSAGQHNLVTRNLFDIEDWRALAPGSMVGMSYFGGYVFFYEDHSGQTMQVKAMWLQLQDSPPLAQMDLAGVGSHSEFFLGSDNKIYQFDADAANDMSGAWKSKVFTLPRPENLSAAQVDADFEDGTVQVSMYADGVLRASMNVMSGAAFRLPAGYKAKDIEIAVQATCAVRSVTLASTVAELRGTA